MCIRSFFFQKKANKTKKPKVIFFLYKTKKIKNKKKNKKKNASKLVPIRHGH